MFVPSGVDRLDQIDIVNGKSTAGAIVHMEQDFGMSEIVIYDVLGNEVSKKKQKMGLGAHAFDVPPSGLVEIKRL